MARDMSERDRIIFGIPVDWDKGFGGTVPFEKMRLGTMEKLIQLGFADPEERQNDSPSIREFVEFLKANPDFTLHGYVVSPKRDDCRVSVEGLALNRAPEFSELKILIENFRHADEFDFDDESFRCWWD